MKTVIGEFIERFIKENSLKYNNTSTSYVFSCPICSKNKLYIRKSDGRAKCWYCSSLHEKTVNGRPEFALSALTGQPVSQVKDFIYGENSYREDILKIDFNEQDLVEEVVLQSTQWPLDFYPIEHTHSIRGVNYLQSRGINLNIAQQYKIRYNPTDRRVAFPVYINDVLYGWQGRLVIPDTYVNKNGELTKIPKALTSKGLPKEHVLMFQNRLDSSEHCVLTEGPISAIKAHLCNGNVASMGKKVSSHQLNIIKNNCKKLYLGLDPDAVDEIKKIVYDCQYELEIYDMVPSKGDLGDLSMEEVFDLFKSAGRLDSSRVFVYFK